MDASMYSENSTINITMDYGILPHRPSRYSCIFAAFCSILFTVMGCFGNWMTIVALARCRRLQNATTAFVVSLAIADFMFCAVCLPLTATRYIHEEWVLGNGLCSLFPFFFYGNVAASLMSMTAITFNRFVLINCNPMYSTLYRRVNVGLMILFCWSFSYVIMLPTLLGRWGHFGYDEASFSCTILRGVDGRSPKKFLFALGFLMPTLTIVVCYSCIFYKVRSSAAKVHSHEDASSKRLSRILPRKREELRVTCTMLACFCTFQLCFLPLMLVNVFEEDIRYPIVHILASVLAWMSACTNPFIYVLLNRHYRAAYFQLLSSWSIFKSSHPTPEGCSVSSRTSNIHVIYREGSRESVSRDVAV